jgi:hypothetical protein
MHGPVWDPSVARLLFGVNPDGEHPDETNSTIEELQALLPENQKPAPPQPAPLAPGAGGGSEWRGSRKQRRADSRVATAPRPDSRKMNTCLLAYRTTRTGS